MTCPSSAAAAAPLASHVRPDKLLVLHYGALGDLLCARPALFALAGAYAELPRYALTGPGSAFFLRSLGYLPCPEELRAFEDAFHGGALPREAAGCLMFRFCLDRLPEHVPHGAHCLRALPEAELPVARALLRQLAEAGVCARIPGQFAGESIVAEECGEFRRSFGSWAGQASGTVGLFPGSGHRAKNWPARNFSALARRLEGYGHTPVQVLGPAEEERGLRLADIPALRPADLPELTRILRGLRLVIGNDSGPLHLAARLGVPCVVLFGPSPAARWGPPGALFLTSPLPCAPCSAAMRGTFCDPPDCMEAIGVERVLRAARGLL